MIKSLNFERSTLSFLGGAFVVEALAVDFVVEDFLVVVFLVEVFLATVGFFVSPFVGVSVASTDGFALGSFLRPVFGVLVSSDCFLRGGIILVL